MILRIQNNSSIKYNFNLLFHIKSMFDLSKINDEKKRVLNVINSKKFLISDYFEILRYSNTISEKNLNYIKKNASSEIVKKENEIFASISNIFFKIIHINYDIKIYKYLKNYLTVNLLNKIESVYKLPDSSLNILDIIFLDSSEEINNDERIDKNIINLNKYQCEFVIIINLDEQINENIISLNLIPDFESKLLKGEAIILCKKHIFSLTTNCKNLLIIPVQFFDGYNLFEYNRHPNEFK